MAVRKRKKKNSAAPLIAVLLLIALAIGAVVYVHAHYNIAMGSLFPKGEPIDLRGRSVSVRQYREIARRCPEAVVLWDVPIGEWSYDCLSEAIAVENFTADEVDSFAFFPSLHYVDARRADCSAEIMQLIERYPALDVRWMVPVGAQRFDSRSEELSVGDFGPDEVKNFNYFPSLKRIDATAASCWPEIMAVRALLGEDVEMKWNVVIGGESFPHTTKELTLPEGVTAEELGEKLQYLPDTRMVDTSNARFERTELGALRSRYPKVRFLFKVTIAGQSVRSNTENINIPENAALDLQELLDHGGDFEELKIINLGSRKMALDDVIAIREAYGGVEVICRTTVCGKDCSTDWKELDLSNRRIEDLGEAEKAVAAMARLEKLYLCDCGIDDETLAALREKYAGQTDIVWRVYLNGIACRTDADNFCMSKFSNEWGYLPYENAAPIRYCTDMVTLDLGHGNFDRIDFVSTMPHLRFLIICSAPVTSLEPLREMTELYYLEMFFTAVRDLEPIQRLPNLRHLNIGHCRLDDYTQLFEMKQLERLWWVDSGLSEAQQQEIRDALPNTKVCFWAWEDNAIGNYWRDDPSYREMRDNLGMNYNVIV
ncbi:MAG: hypothetical protein IJH48_05930 [Oscillospiraceae bacterium]|nr:hypothetical protein [Oscillospiraceae bacterium]